MWFDLYRKWGAYHHPDFELQRQFIFQQAGKRPLTYRPESAYWCTADIDVPAFLPEYIRARWIDVNGLVGDLAAKGLPPLDGHVVFSSGHEWGYWLTDYLTAKMAWDPTAPLSHFVDLATGHYAACAPEARQLFDDFLALEGQYLFDAKLMPYVSGEDFYDDSGALLGIETHPPRVPFETLYFGDETQRSQFETQVIGLLDTAVIHITDVENRAAALCAKSDSVLMPWCSELYDGISIVRLRLAHSSALYKAVLAGARKQPDAAAAHLSEAETLRASAALVVTNREQHYRFPVDQLTAAYPNPTAYPFGYLRQAHTLCYWKRQHEQAAHLVDKGSVKLFATLPGCLD
jgi:hypothetical protein